MSRQHHNACLGNLQLQLYPNAIQLAECQRLRERVFAHELGWVPPSGDGRERDKFDQGSLHVAILQHWQIIGYLRVTPANRAWMLDRCFAFLLDTTSKMTRPMDSLEVSRLAVDPAYRGKIDRLGFSVLDWLIRGLVEHAKRLECRYWYVVLARPVYLLLQAKGLDCQLLGEVRKMPDGVETLAARIDMERFLRKAPTFFEQSLKLPIPSAQTAMTP